MALLKACPNCGCHVSVHKKKKGTYSYHFWCECDGCWTQTDKYHSEEEATRAWNALEKEAPKENE